MNKDLLRENEALSKHSTFRVGGNAKYFYEAIDIFDLPELIKWAKDQDLPYVVIGVGSNILFKDEGFPGLIIKITANEVSFEGDNIIAEAGAKISSLAEFGLGAFSTLPGTVGGAVCGNAGYPDIEIKDVLVKAWILKDGKIVEVDPEYFEFGYRHSKLKDSDEILLKAAFLPHEGVEIDRSNQPAGMTAGSFFKNPPGESAGRLIDQCGLKGKKVGGAQISDKHANFILNTGTATASDILELAEMAKKAVKGQFDIDLKEEVRIIG